LLTKIWPKRNVAVYISIHTYLQMIIILFADKVYPNISNNLVIYIKNENEELEFPDFNQVNACVLGKVCPTVANQNTTETVFISVPSNVPLVSSFVVFLIF